MGDTKNRIVHFLLPRGGWATVKPLTLNLYTLRPSRTGKSPGNLVLDLLVRRIFKVTIYTAGPVVLVNLSMD